MQRGKPVTGPSKQRARLRSVTADPQIVAAAFRDGTTPLLSCRSCKATIRPGSMLCRKTWRTVAPPTPCARSVTLTYPNCRASYGEGLEDRVRLCPVGPTVDAGFKPALSAYA